MAPRVKDHIPPPKHTQSFLIRQNSEAVQPLVSQDLKVYVYLWYRRQFDRWQRIVFLESTFDAAIAHRL